MSLRTQRVELLSKARLIATKAGDDGRDLTDTEHHEVEGLLRQVDELDVRIAKADAPDSAKSVLTRIGTLTHPERDGLPSGGSGLWDEDTKSRVLAAVQSKAPIRTLVSNTRFKAAIGATTLLPTTGEAVSPTPPGTGAVLLREFFLPANATGPTQRIYQMGAATAAVVAEAAQKPDSGLTVTPIDKPLIKIASVTKLTDELLEDAGFLMQFIQAEVVLGTLRKENAEIVTTINGASGIMTATGTLATAIDVLAGAIGSTEALNGVTPKALLINPTNLATMRTQKASTGGSYFIEPFGTGPSTLHGVPLYPTASVAAGTAFLLTEGFGVFYTRDRGIQVDIGLDGGDFSSNLQTLRVEERVLPAVTRPALVTKVTLT